MAIYKPPFKYEHGYIFDADHHMVADDGSIDDTEPSVSNAIACRIRGWGRIGYMPNPEKLQDEVGAMVADALTAYYTTSPATQAALTMAQKLADDRLAQMQADRKQYLDVKAVLARALGALKNAEGDINWMLNTRQFLNWDVFDYLDSAIAEIEGLGAKHG